MVAVQVDIRTQRRHLSPLNASVTSLCAIAVAEAGETHLLDMCDGTFKSLIRFDDVSASEEGQQVRVTSADRNRVTVRILF